MVSEIGYCEWCGILDHHLEAGQCPGCAQKVIDWPTTIREQQGVAAGLTRVTATAGASGLPILTVR